MQGVSVTNTKKYAQYPVVFNTKTNNKIDILVTFSLKYAVKGPFYLIYTTGDGKQIWYVLNINTDN